MPKNKPRETSKPTSIEEALVNGDELAVARECARKYARVLDMTDSGRDIKPLVTGLFEAIAKVHALEAAEGYATETPYAQIMREAEEALAHAQG